MSFQDLPAEIIYEIGALCNRWDRGELAFANKLTFRTLTRYTNANIFLLRNKISDYELHTVKYILIENRYHQQETVQRALNLTRCLQVVYFEERKTWSYDFVVMFFEQIRNDRQLIYIVPKVVKGLFELIAGLNKLDTIILMKEEQGQVTGSEASKLVTQHMKTKQ